MSESGQHYEPEEEIANLITKFGLFTVEAAFTRDENGVETCTDPQMKGNVRRLFRALGYEKEINSKSMSCSVVRMRPGTTSLGARSADLWPVYVWGKNPKVNGAEVVPGQSARIRDGGTIQVDEGSAVDLLYLVEKKATKK